MALQKVDGWSKLNVYPLQSGELAARPGLRRVQDPDTGRKFVGGFSVLNPYTSEVWHYLFDVISATTTSLRLRIVDEDFVTWQEFLLGVNVDPRVITHAVVEGELVITSPDFDTLWGLVGSGITYAKKVASDNPATTAIDVPRGICTSWCNRVVIANGASLFISDPVSATGGSTRTYVGQNQNQRPAPVFGLHEGAGGQLIVLTSRGVYGLDASAAAVGIVGSNGTDWRLLNHHETYTYQSSAVIRGRCFALSKAGYLLVDIENDKEEALDDLMMPRAYGPRIASNDYRAARMLAGDEGPYVAYGDALSAHALADGIRSWWTTSAGDQNLVADPNTLASWTLSANVTRTVAAGVMAPDGGTTYQLTRTTATPSSTGASTPLSFSTNGTKTIELYLLAGTASITDINLYDATAVVDRCIVRATWSGSVPTMSIQSGSGAIVSTTDVGYGWYRVVFTVNGVIAANSNSILIYPPGIPAGTGSVRVWRVVAYDGGAPFRVRGLLRTADGEEMLVAEDGVYQMSGNFDGGRSLYSYATAQPKAVFSGLVPMDPTNNPTVREVTYAASLGGDGAIHAAVRGQAQSDTAPADTRSLVIGTSSWGATGTIYQPTPIASRRLQFDLNGDDVSIEVAADYPETRLHAAADVAFSKSAPQRPNDRGN